MVQKLLCLGVLAILAGSSEARAQRLLGTTAPVRNSVSNAVKVLPEGRMAIIYDRPSPQAVRVRVLDQSGRLTLVPTGLLGNTLYDEFAWSGREQTIYALAADGPLYRWNRNGRVFELIGGRPFEYRAMRYIPRYGSLVLVGKSGLSVVRSGHIVPLRSSGAPVGELFYVRDAPKFGALLLGNDKEQFLRTADARIYHIGQGGIEMMAELSTRPAIQLVGPKVAFDVGLVRTGGGAWSPAHIERVGLAWTFNGMLRSFVPTLDSFLIGQPGLLDGLLRRSGFYRLGPEGLRPVGDGRQRGTKFPNHIALPSKGLDLLELNRRPAGPTQFWAIRADGTMRVQSWPNAAGRYFNILEKQGISYLTGASGVWFWSGREQPTRVASYGFAANYALPLTRETLFTDGRTAVVLNRSGRATRIPRFAPGEVLQTGQDRLIVVGRNILEFRLPQRG